jgi:GR25 family glycosyltransferase involved in LPS biosynthesis
MYTLIIVLVIISIFFLFYTRTKKDGFKAKNKKDYLDGVDVIYWINLDRSPDRRQRMEKMFEDQVFKGKKIIRISAVDGKAQNIDDIINKRFERSSTSAITNIEYACTLSHIKAVEQFSNSNYKTALIMEDDMTLEFKPYWKKSVKQIMDAAPGDWEIIQLCYIISNTTPRKLYTKNTGNLFSTGAYVINKNNINIPQKINTETAAADTYLYSIFNTYTYKYPMFIYKNNESSTIHQEHINHHDTSKQKILSFFT